MLAFIATSLLYSSVIFDNQMTQVIPIFALNLILKVHTYTGKSLIIGIASLKTSCRLQNRNGKRGLKEE